MMAQENADDEGDESDSRESVEEDSDFEAARKSGEDSLINKSLEQREESIHIILKTPVTPIVL